MLLMILNASSGSWGEMFFTMFLLFGGIFFVGYIYALGMDVNETKKRGGIKGIYPNIIKFIMKTYPNARVTLDSSFYMTIESKDKGRDITRIFSLRINPHSKDVKIVGKLIPGNTQWAWAPPKEYIWYIETKYGGGSYSEGLVIKQMSRDMVCNL